MPSASMLRDETLIPTVKSNPVKALLSVHSWLLLATPRSDRIGAMLATVHASKFNALKQAGSSVGPRPS